jgi:NAD(P)H-dependent FMN reductase
MPKLQVIMGTTRPTGASEHVTPWVVERAECHEAFDVELLGLRDLSLPSSLGAFGHPRRLHRPELLEPDREAVEHQDRRGRQRAVRRRRGHRSVPAALKNAIDSVFVSFARRDGPAGLGDYSAGVAAGPRAVEHHALIPIEQDSSSAIPPLSRSSQTRSTNDTTPATLTPGRHSGSPSTTSPGGPSRSTAPVAKANSRGVVFRAREAAAARAAASPAGEFLIRLSRHHSSSPWRNQA